MKQIFQKKFLVIQRIILIYIFLQFIHLYAFFYDIFSYNTFSELSYIFYILERRLIHIIYEYLDIGFNVESISLAELFIDDNQGIR